MPIVLPTLTPFTGNRVDLHIIFIPAVMHAARLASTHPNQMLFSIMTPEQRAAHWPAEAHVGLPLVPPIPNANATAGEFKLWQAHQRTMEMFVQEENTFHAWLVSALTEDIKVAITSTALPFNRMNAAQILQALRNTYGTIQATDLEEQVTLTRQPIQVGKPIKDFIAVHQFAHHVHSCAGSPMTENAKVQAMKAALEATAAYQPCVVMFNHDHPTVESQTMANLLTALRNYPVPAHFTTPQVLQANQAAAQTPTNKLKPVKAARNHQQRTKYCWTHGLCSHIGKECRSKADTHVDEADVNNRMGGSNKGFRSQGPNGGKHH